MLTVFQYGDIRRAFRDGMSVRETARTFHCSRRKIRQILAEGQPRPYTRTQPTSAPMLGAFHGFIDTILAEDENAPPKQRHTAMQVYRRLRDEHAYRGGYDAVRRYHARTDAVIQSQHLVVGEITLVTTLAIVVRRSADSSLPNPVLVAPRIPRC